MRYTNPPFFKIIPPFSPTNPHKKNQHTQPLLCVLISFNIKLWLLSHHHLDSPVA